MEKTEEVVFTYTIAKEDNKKRIQVFDDYLLNNIRQKIRKLREEEKQALEYQNPTIHEISDMVNAYSSRIYERNGLEDDFLTVNLGCYKGASGISVKYREKELDVNKDYFYNRGDVKKIKLIDNR